jgi:hypothetical protein
MSILEFIVYAGNLRWRGDFRDKFIKHLSRARFDAPFDLVASRAIYSPLAESHEEIHSSSAEIHLSSAVKEQRGEGHRSGEERVAMVD